MKARGVGLVLGLLMVAACGGSSNGQLSLELGYRESNQLRELSLGIVPEKWEGSADSIEAWVRQYGGRVLSRERQEDRRITLMLRLPVAQAESLVIKVKSLGYVFAEEVKRTDVGQSFSSIESQIRLKEEAIARYRELFKNARTSSEILEIEKALSATLQERDSLVSLLEGLRAKIGTVLILVQLVNARYAGMGAGGSFWSQFGRALVEGWDLFQQFLIGLAYLWWLWVGTALFIYLLIRYSRRTGAKKPSTPPPSPGERAPS
jgi:hypothetical protein